MSTSIQDGLVVFAGSLYGAAADPVGSRTMRDGIANNLLHCADSFAQVRVNYCPIGAAFDGNDLDSFETIEDDPVAGTWYAVGGGPFGGWPLTMHADGAVPYVLRVRLGVSASDTDAGVTLTWRVVIAPDGDGLEELPNDADHVFEVSGAASTTVAWATGTSQGALTHATLLTVSPELATAWTRSVGVYDAVSSAEPSAVDQVLVNAWVYARTEDASFLPRVNALHITEYVGL